jgi:hypothetical protein
VSVVVFQEEFEAEHVSRAELNSVEDSFLLEMRKTAEQYAKALLELAQATDKLTTIVGSYKLQDERINAALLSRREILRAEIATGFPRHIESLVSRLTPTESSEYYYGVDAYISARGRFLAAMDSVMAEAAKQPEEDPADFWGPDWKEMIDQARAELHAGGGSHFGSDEDFTSSL